MQGAIIADIWGSIFETIPKFPRRLFMSPTDDTFLTCACYEFMQSLSEDEKQNPKNYFESIYLKASTSLKKWGRLFPEPGAYSTGFLNWSKTDDHSYKVASTNGCLMRQSPIAMYAHINNLTLDNCIELSRIFCYPTHKSDESFRASAQHISIIYLILQSQLNKSDLKEKFSDLIHPLSYWQELSTTVKNNFIWKASDSLGIALSGVYATDNWEDMMRFFISISGDVDTYAAIAGPIAQLYFAPPTGLDIIENVLFSSHDPRFKIIQNIYMALANDFKFIE